MANYVPTKASILLSRQQPNVEVVKFESYKPKEKKNIPNDLNKFNSKSKYSSQPKELDLKKIRHDIVKFGMSGFSAPKKEEARIALAVSLGAKPPKKQYKNYKELMEERKEEKKAEAEERALQILGKEAGLKALQKQNKKNKKGNDVGKLLNVYGKFLNDEEYTLKHYYYDAAAAECDDKDSHTASKSGASRKRVHSSSISDFFVRPEKKKEAKLTSSSVAQPQQDGVGYISTGVDDGVNATHLIKIEIYELKKIKKISPAQQWKHADVRLRYYAKEQDDNHLNSAQDLVYRITKDIAQSENCKKYFYDNQ